jgi:hypothetical protein
MTMERRSVLLEGVVVGLAGATAVAIWYLLYDLTQGVPFRTPAVLAAALFHGLRDAGALTITPGLVLEYSLLHGAAFILFGLAAAGLFALVDRDRRVLFAIFMLFCCFEVFALAMITVLGAWLFHTLPPWTIIGGNLTAGLIMLAILFRDHSLSLSQVMISAD